MIIMNKKDRRRCEEANIDRMNVIESQKENQM